MNKGGNYTLLLLVYGEGEVTVDAICIFVGYDDDIRDAG